MKPSVSTADLTKLVDTVCSAAKSAEGDPAEQGRALDGLRALKKQTVTTKLLSDTQAGKRIRALSKHADPDIARLAGEVVGAWKEVVRRDASAMPSGGSAPQPSGARSEGGAAASSMQTDGSELPSSSQATSRPPRPASGGAAAAAAAAAAPAAAAPAVEFDPAQLAKSGDTVRDKCRLNLALALQMSVNEGNAGNVALSSVAVENELFKANGGVTAAYKAKFRNLHFNLKDEKNPDLRRKVLTGAIPPDTLLTLPPEELASDAKKEENAAIREKKLFHAAPSAAKQATTDQFQCGKCRQRKCTYYQMQTRSADEPMTTFVTCLNCNNRWKFC